MKVIAFNGSPRKNFNTATLLRNALEGAAEAGAETVLVHLYDMSFSGCRSCLACKSRSRPRTGRCVLRDAITPHIEESLNADVILLGSPIYFYTESSSMRAFMERLLFPITRYEKERSLLKKNIKTALFYTMNISEEEVTKRNPPFPDHFSLSVIEQSAYFIKRIFGHCETLLCTDTMQVQDYSKFYMDIYDGTTKKRRHDEVFPLDCRRARALGRRLASSAPDLPDKESS